MLQRIRMVRIRRKTHRRSTKRMIHIELENLLLTVDISVMKQIQSHLPKKISTMAYWSPNLERCHVHTSFKFQKMKN